MVKTLWLHFNVFIFEIEVYLYFPKKKCVQNNFTLNYIIDFMYEFHIESFRIILEIKAMHTPRTVIEHSPENSNRKR